MQAGRTPLTPQLLVSVCRQLLHEGGPEAIVVREVARRADVTAPALYKHVDGRHELLTLLIAACSNEVADACAAGRDTCDPQDYGAQLLSATAAFRAWSLANRPEFGLIYGTPITGYAAPCEGPTTDSFRRFGAVFAGIYLGLLSTDRLVLAERASMSENLFTAITAKPLPGGYHLPPEAAYQFAVGWQRLLGMVSVEVSGHLDWMMDGSEAFMQRQVEALGAEIIVPLPSLRP